MKILWCITGAGHFLEDSVKYMEKNKNEITVAFSNAGYEVSQMYGFLENIKKVANEVIMESEQGFSNPVVGRLARKEYDKIVIAPCTANTVAKIVHGVADSLVSNIAAQAVKSKTAVYVLPTDIKKEVVTKIPINLDLKICRNCEKCIPIERCPKNAIYRTKEGVRINLLKCDACLLCIEECEYNAISFGKEVKVKTRKIDLENAKKLKKTEGLEVIESVESLSF